MPVNIEIDVDESIYNKAAYVFKVFSSIWGLVVKLSKPGYSEINKIHILYTNKTKYLGFIDNKFVIPYDSLMFMTSTICNIFYMDGYTLWGNNNKNIDIDIVASTFRLLTFMDESQVCSRDKKGIFITSELPENRFNSALLPLVIYNAEFILNKLLYIDYRLKNQIVHRWPNNKKFAISITHDVDAAYLGHYREITTNFSKYLIRKNNIFLNMAKEGIKCINNPKHDPFLNFEKWQKYEDNYGIKSCFYLFVRPSSVKRQLNDCKSDLFSSFTKWQPLVNLANNGWEFGYHPPINAKNCIDEFLYGKKIIEEKIESFIFGLRHHYWALDWLYPYKTFRKHLNAGFRYDTSIAWKDQAGLRAATCLPFKPFDPIRDTELNIYQLPTCLMDGHIIKEDTYDNIISSGLEIINICKQVGGVAVLDWHAESFISKFIYKNHLEILDQIINKVLADNKDDVWVTTPWEIVKWWNKRDELLAEKSYE